MTGQQLFTTVLLFLQLIPLTEAERARSDDNDPLMAVVEKLSTDVVSLQAQLTAQMAQVAAQTAELAAQKSQFESKLTAQRTDFENQLSVQSKRIAELEAFNNQTVAFSAFISYDHPNVPASAGSTVPFRSIISNVGAAYNPASSVFTAPVDGHYFFIIHADCSADYRYIHVLVNGKHVFSADNDGNDRHVTGSGLVNLTAGDVVSAIHITSDGFLDNGYESTFSGFWVK